MELKGDVFFNGWKEKDPYYVSFFDCTQVSFRKSIERQI